MTLDLSMSKYSKLNRNDSHYQTVTALSSASSDTIIPTGETWRIVKFVGNAAYLDDTVVSLVWDYGGAGERILAASHGDSEVLLDESLVGDGVKKLSLVLTNDTASGRILGGQWEGF